MLFIKNKDIPGVVGKVGMLLSEFDVNIGEYLLSRTKSNDFAFSVVKVDEQISSDLLEKLILIDEILSIKQIKI